MRHPPTALALAAALFAACSPGAAPPRDVATGQTHPYLLAVNHSDVWFIIQDVGSNISAVMRVPKSGGTPVMVDDTQPFTVLAADDAGACFAAGYNTTGTVRCAGPAGENPHEVGHPNGNPRFVGTLGLDADNVYWADGSGSVFASPRTGPSAMRTVGVTDTGLGLLVVDADGVWAPTLHGARRFLKDGSGYTDYSFAQEPPLSMALGGDTLYASFGAAGHSDGTIVRVPLATGQPLTVAMGLTVPNHVQVFGDRVLYITEATGSAGGVYAAYTSGGAVTPIATGFYASDVATDGTSVFWTEPETGAVRATTP